MPEFTILSFDSELFEFKVAKILSPRLNTLELQALLMQLAAQDVRLVYWPADSTDEATQEAAKKLQGFLGSQQVTYKIDLRKLDLNLTKAEEVEIYNQKTPNIELENLAIQAGTYSRFRTDPKFSYDLFYKLYTTWVANAVSGEAADAVMVVKRGAKIAGMITVGSKNGYGEIIHLAVFPEYRGQNIGTHLVQAAQLYWQSQGLAQGQVVTQLANKPACSLYEKCKFISSKVENFYHFWL